MWLFKKKAESPVRSGMFTGFTDWHSHVLPGVDDGIKTLDESLEVLRRYEELGVKRLWLTPHIMEDYPNKTDDLRNKFEELKQAWNGSLELRLASENMLDSLFETRLEANDFLPIGEEGNHILVETSYFNPPMKMDELLEEIMRKGYFPVLAHPERYRYMDTDDYERYHEMGIVFQTNFLSLLGFYGETAQKKIEWLLKKGLADITGSDLHRVAVIDKFDSSPRSQDMTEAILKVARQTILI